MKLRDFIPPIVTRMLGHHAADSVKLADIQRSVEDAKILAARALIGRFAGRESISRLSDTEFKVFSQFGDDGIIQHLIQQVETPRTFVEFGVENYTEANTRFLLVNDNWRGLVMDGSQANITAIQRDEIHWRFDLTAVCAFIDRDNINDLIAGSGFGGELGILSIDIDGNDYWVWERIDVVQPVIVVAEYNSVFGPDLAVSIPYDPSFHRTTAHFSNLYWGCSLKALCLLAERKGLAFVGCNGNGNNAYFVRKDRLGPLQPLTAEQGFVESRFRESRDPRGKLTYLSGRERLRAISDQRVVDVESGDSIQIEQLADRRRAA